MRSLLVTVLAVSGCTVGEVGPTGAGPDAPVGGNPDASAGPDAPAGLTFGTCRDQVTANLGNGHHNAGQDCQSGCHDHGFTLSGTVYTSAAGTTPAVGATITIKDAAGVMFDVVSATNGNFSTTRAVTFPVLVVASSCPSATPMSGSIAAGNGGCNKSGCHVPGVGQGAVHVP